MLSRVLPLVVALAASVNGQSGGFFNSVANLYSDTTCSNSSLIFANPNFGDGNVCQSLDANNDIPPIIGYQVFEESQGCSVTIYTTDDCTGHAYKAGLNQCVSAGGAQFLTAFVTCPTSR